MQSTELYPGNLQFAAAFYLRRVTARNPDLGSAEVSDLCCALATRKLLQ